jgi:hypothetical protein
MVRDTIECKQTGGIFPHQVVDWWSRVAFSASFNPLIGQVYWHFLELQPGSSGVHFVILLWVLLVHSHFMVSCLYIRHSHFMVSSIHPASKNSTLAGISGAYRGEAMTESRGPRWFPLEDEWKGKESLQQNQLYGSSCMCLSPFQWHAAESISTPLDRMSVCRRFFPGTNSHLGGVRKVPG